MIGQQYNRFLTQPINCVCIERGLASWTREQFVNTVSNCCFVEVSESLATESFLERKRTRLPRKDGTNGLKATESWPFALHIGDACCATVEVFSGYLEGWNADPATCKHSRCGSWNSRRLCHVKNIIRMMRRWSGIKSVKGCFSAECDPDSIMAVLDLQHRNLTSVPTELLKQQPHLEELYLDANLIREVPRVM